MNARTWFAVVRPDSTPDLYPTRAYAEAVAEVNRFQFPSIGPWEVVELREVVAQADVRAVAA